VVFNGAPRSGKSSIIAALQARGATPWLNLGVDVFSRYVTPPRLRPGMGLRPGGGERPDIEALLPSLYAAFYDSVAVESARRIFDDRIRYADRLLDVLDGAHGLAVCTDWNEFKHPDFDEIFEESTLTILEEVERLKRIVTEFSRFARLPRPQPVLLDVREIAEHVRARLARQLCAQHQAPGGYVPIIALAPAPPSSAGWKITTAVPSKLRVSARYLAAPSSIAVWPSWPQACILPGLCEA
jgi:hypothetical protein